MLMTEHNLSFYQRLMQGLRDAIREGGLTAHAAAFRDHYGQGKRPG
jgi:queuine tRNA-ribosyltransferase